MRGVNRKRASLEYSGGIFNVFGSKHVQRIFSGEFCGSRIFASMATTSPTLHFCVGSNSMTGGLSAARTRIVTGSDVPCLRPSLTSSMTL